MTVQLDKVEHVFRAVLALRQSSENATIPYARFDEICEHDADLRAEVESLLRHFDTCGQELEDSGFLNPSELHGTRAAGIVRDAAFEEWGGSAVGQRIGDFIIIGQLDAGAMGIVYKAEQQRPRRMVALKVIRRTIATTVMVARFEREAELLGRLSHPGIAQIFAAGVASVEVSDGGSIRVPYIAMELIDGKPIVEHVRTYNTEFGDVLTLIAQACDAIQHAHQRGVIHRDVKPANILVAFDGVEAKVKVLDFGVARAVAANPLDESMTRLTTHGSLIGTPAYMSPEQVVGDPANVGEPCDTYALGAILYELLAGRAMIDLDHCSLPEAVTRILHQKPQRLGLIDDRFRGDVETIVAKATAKDIKERYQTPQKFAADIRRFLANEPLEAKRESFGRQVRLFAARNRILAVPIIVIAAIWLYVMDLQNQFTASRIEQGQLLATAGNLPAAEDVLWSEYSAHPNSAAVQEALRQLYARHGDLRVNPDVEKECRAEITTPNGQTIATGGDNGVVHAWNTASEQAAAEIHLPFQRIRCLEFSADGSMLVAGGASGVVLLDPRAGRTIRALTSRHGTVNSADVSRDGKWIACASDDGTVEIWGGNTGKSLLVLSESQTAGVCVRFDRSATRLAATFRDGSICEWRVAQDGSDPRPNAGLVWHRESSATTLNFSPDGALLAIGTTAGSVQVWNGADGAEIAEVRPQAPGR